MLPEDQKTPEPTPPKTPGTPGISGTPGIPGKPSRSGKSFQAPRGARDFFPDEMARRRYIFDAWRKTALRHGFDEIDGPTFEHLDLYTVKSGEGIVNELFSFRRAGGETDFALRPEFTPTLARMVAAKANSLPKPIKWFSIGNFFRAERPQRGRLREFSQWNVDILGDDSPERDAELITCCVNLLSQLGLTSDDVQVNIGHRSTVERFFRNMDISQEKYNAWFDLLDRRDKLSEEDFVDAGVQLGESREKVEEIRRTLIGVAISGMPAEQFMQSERISWQAEYLAFTLRQLEANGLLDWCYVDLGIVRGLAYYTGMVFEVHETGGKERAIAGGGRYDNLVELFGGPPTPAVGFAMGDVVLSLVLQDKGLIPEGAELLEKTGARPDVFVISNGQDESEAALRPTVARLRREGLHARHTHRSTRNVGKLLKEASSCHARWAVIIESTTACTLKDLDSGEEHKEAPLDGIVQRIRR